LTKRSTPGNSAFHTFAQSRIETTRTHRYDPLAVDFWGVEEGVLEEFFTESAIVNKLWKSQKSLCE